jgi:hypothetical protein
VQEEKIISPNVKSKILFIFLKYFVVVKISN